MIYLSAQPAAFYFLWQLELQLFNFNRLNIPRENINVLIGYDSDRGLDIDFENFISNNSFGTFFIYPDTRIKKEYDSSLRPHIIKKHFEAFPHLVNEVIFYHDSDVIFRKVPDFAALLKGDTWYVSDTRSYLDSKYIIRSAGEALFYELCEKVGVSPQTVVLNDGHAGGAQYLLKNLKADFWAKVEEDSESLFAVMNAHNHKCSDEFQLVTNKRKSQYTGIQAWCADMWSLFWNALLMQQEVRIHNELDFCWPKNDLDAWFATNILHYSGVLRAESDRYFCKGNYVHFSPFFDRFDQIRKDSCSFPLVLLIEQYAKAIRRHDFRDVTFILYANVIDDDFSNRLEMAKRYISRQFDTGTFDLITVNKGEEGNEDPENFNKTLRTAVAGIESPIVVIYNVNTIPCLTEIYQAVIEVRNTGKGICLWEKDAQIIDGYFAGIFNKVLDYDLLMSNSGKFAFGENEEMLACQILNVPFFKDCGSLFGAENDPMDYRQGALFKIL